MADPNALETLKQNVRLWNENWNSLNRHLNKADPHGLDLIKARLQSTNLTCSNLEECDLSNAHLERADLCQARWVCSGSPGCRCGADRGLPGLSHSMARGYQNIGKVNLCPLKN
jgi:uncharacterized protein YjbI with pentapeptide repeats